MRGCWPTRKYAPSTDPLPVCSRSKEVKALRQRVLHCPCTNAKVLALGLCSTCYTLKRQDEEHSGGLREAVLERDGHRCRVCDASGRDKRSIIVHHRVAGRSVLSLMISLCPGCHAKVHRTKAVLARMPPNAWVLKRNAGPSRVLSVHKFPFLELSPSWSSSSTVKSRWWRTMPIWRCCLCRRTIDRLNEAVRCRPL